MAYLQPLCTGIHIIMMGYQVCGSISDLITLQG